MRNSTDLRGQDRLLHKGACATPAIPVGRKAGPARQVFRCGRTNSIWTCSPAPLADYGRECRQSPKARDGGRRFRRVGKTPGVRHNHGGEIAVHRAAAVEVRESRAAEQVVGKGEDAAWAAGAADRSAGVAWSIR